MVMASESWGVLPVGFRGRFQALGTHSGKTALCRSDLHAGTAVLRPGEPALQPCRRRALSKRGASGLRAWNPESVRQAPGERPALRPQPDARPSPSGCPASLRVVAEPGLPCQDGGWPRPVRLTGDLGACLPVSHPSTPRARGGGRPSDASAAGRGDGRGSAGLRMEPVRRGLRLAVSVCGQSRCFRQPRG